jgi:hypothetical protein
MHTERIACFSRARYIPVIRKEAPMTQDQRRRVEQAIDETQRGLARAMRYSPEFRDMKLIGDYERHTAKLVRCLETNTMPTFGKA